MGTKIIFFHRINKSLKILVFHIYYFLIFAFISHHIIKTGTATNNALLSLSIRKLIHKNSFIKFIFLLNLYPISFSLKKYILIIQTLSKSCLYLY